MSEWNWSVWKMSNMVWLSHTCKQNCKKACNKVPDAYKMSDVSILIQIKFESKWKCSMGYNK